MVVDVLKARLGMGDGRRQYTDIESVRDLDDVSDPSTTDNQSKTTAREVAADHPYAAIIAAVVAFVAGGLGLMYTLRLAPDVLTSKWTWIGTGGLLYTGFVYRRGWRARDRNVTQYDTLTLKMNGEETTYKGTFVDLAGRAPAFIPIKGWDRWGHAPKPYLNADLGAAMVDSFQAHKMTEDSPAVIRLEPGEYGDLMSMTDSDWGGTHITQETSGLKPDPHGNQTSLYATFPEFDDERANSLAEQLQQVERDYHDVRQEADSLMRRNRNLKERLNEPIEDEVDSRIGQLERLSHAADGRRPRRRNGDTENGHRTDWRGTGTVGASAAEQELQAVEEEVSGDDDD
jgi:hypothetical protein